jgi:hypothetical protein
MRNAMVRCILVFLCGIAGAVHGDARQPAGGSEYAGTWSGTWDGAGEGKFDLTLASGSGAMTGKVAVTTDNGNYDAMLRAIVFTGKKMTAKYDFPLDPSSEVVVMADFDAKTSKGTWSLRPKGQDAEIAGGTFSLSRQ